MDFIFLHDIKNNNKTPSLAAGISNWSSEAYIISDVR